MSMKAVVNLGKLTLELESDNHKDLFEELSTVQEVFDNNTCQACGCEDVRFVVREVDDNKFYEIRCMKCRARLSFGAHKKGNTLFPKRKDANGKFLENKGWTVWQGAKNQGNGEQAQDGGQTKF